MKIYIKSILLLLVFLVSSCQSLVEDINDNPNDFNLDEVNAELF